MDRRTFTISLAAAAAAATVPAVVSGGTPFALAGVWIGDGPIIVERLRPGLRLAIEQRRRRPCVFGDNRFLGFLPVGRAVPGGALELASAGLDVTGRLCILVRATQGVGV